MSNGSFSDPYRGRQTVGRVEGAESASSYTPIRSQRPVRAPQLPGTSARRPSTYPRRAGGG